MVHTFNASTWEAEAGESLSLRSAWSPEQFQGNRGSGLHRQTLSRKNKKQEITELCLGGSLYSIVLIRFLLQFQNI